MKKLLTILFLFIVSMNLLATNYYVKNTGNNANTGLSDAQAWTTIAKVNTLAPTGSDTIYFNRGDTWVVAATNGSDALNIHHSGTSGHQITYSAYGTGNKPIFTGRTVIVGWATAGNWTDGGGNIWHMTITNGTAAYSDNTRGRLWVNGVELMHSSSTTVPTTLVPWTHNGTILYVYSVGNPATTFSSMEDVGVTYYSLYCVADYITIQNLDLRGSSESMYMINSDSIIIENCNIGYDCGQYGLRAEFNNGITIRNNTFDTGDRLNDLWYAQNTEAGIWVRTGNHTWDIYNNSFMDWGHSAYDLTATDPDNPTTNILFHNNYMTCANSDYGRGFAVAGYTGLSGVEIYDNYIYNIPTQNQLDAPGVKIHNNIIDGVRGMLSYRADGACGIFIYLSNIFSDAPNNIEIDNNTIMNCLNPGISVHGTITFAGTSVHDNYIRNNIIYNCDATGHYQIYIYDLAGVLNQTFQNNLLYSTGVTDLVYYGHSATNDYAHTIAEFNAENGTASDVVSGNIGGDPLFVSTTNFHLKTASPAIGAGLNVGLLTDYSGKNIPLLPTIGAYEYGVNVAISGGKILTSGGKILVIPWQ